MLFEPAVSILPVDSDIASAVSANRQPKSQKIWALQPDLATSGIALATPGSVWNPSARDVKAEAENKRGAAEKQIRKLLKQIAIKKQQPFTPRVKLY